MKRAIGIQSKSFFRHPVPYHDKVTIPTYGKFTIPYHDKVTIIYHGKVTILYHGKVTIPYLSMVTIPYHDKVTIPIPIPPRILTTILGHPKAGFTSGLHFSPPSHLITGD